MRVFFLARGGLHWFLEDASVWATFDEKENKWFGWEISVLPNAFVESETRNLTAPTTEESTSSITPWSHSPSLDVEEIKCWPGPVLDDSDAPYYRWFPGGKSNAVFNEVDRHVLMGRGKTTALIAEGICKVEDSAPICKGEIKKNPHSL